MISVVGLLGTALTLLLARRGGAPTPAPPPNTGSPAPSGPIPSGADAQLQWATRLVAEIEADREELKVDLAAAKAKVAQLEERVGQQAQTILDLRSILADLSRRPPGP